MRVFVLSVAVFCVLISPAAAQGPAGDESAVAYRAQVQTGIRRITARDYDRAIEALREAIETAPNEPDAHYYVGAAQRLKGDFEDALATFRSALGLSRRSEDILYTARCLQAVAETLERIATAPPPGSEGGGARVVPGRLTEARQAWQEVLSFAQHNASVISPEVARARIQAIDQVLEQERTYENVRRRIADREEELRQQQREQQERQRRGGH